MSGIAAQKADVVPWLSWERNAVTVQVVARPGSSRRRIVRVDPRGVVVALNSPPEKGRANDELIDFLARTVSVPRSSITIVRGATSRHKTVRITSSDPAKTVTILRNAASTE